MPLDTDSKEYAAGFAAAIVLMYDIIESRSNALYKRGIRRKDIRMILAILDAMLRHRDKLCTVGPRNMNLVLYKSGKVEERELHVADAEPDWSKVSDKWFQLMTYEWLYHHTCHGGQPHVSGIFPLRHLHSQLLTASWEGADVITSGHLATFEEMLKQIVSELLDPRVPFLPNYGCRLCQYCPFSEICKL